MDQSAFVKGAEAVGFTHAQALFLFQHTAQKPHTHAAEEIIIDPSDGETLDITVGEFAGRLEEIEAEQYEQAIDVPEDDTN